MTQCIQGRLWGGGLYGRPKRSFYTGSSFKALLQLKAAANHVGKPEVPAGIRAVASVARSKDFLLVSDLADRQPEPGVMSLRQQCQELMQGRDSDAVKFERVRAMARSCCCLRSRTRSWPSASKCCSS